MDPNARVRIGRALPLDEGSGYLVDFEEVKTLAYAFLAAKGYPKRPEEATHGGPYPPV